MIRIAALLLWLYLLTPALHVGKSWQSHAELGPVVTVNFKTGPVDGQMLYTVDGGAWLRDHQGTEYRLDGTEAIAGQLGLHRDRSTFDILCSTWRGVFPVVFITVLLVSSQFRRKP